MDNEAILDIVPKQGERQFITGGTGQGKTSFTVWLLKRIPLSPILIYDIKIEPKFETLPYHKVVTTIREIDEAVKEGLSDYIIVRPHESLLTDPSALDAFLMHHYFNLHGMVAYVDELKPFHRGYMAGPGLTNILQRGRSKGITAIMSTQRPSGIDRSCITEAQSLVSFRLQDKKDRLRLDDLIENFSEMEVPKKHHFYYWNADMEKPLLFAPVKLDPGADKGYTDGDPGEAVKDDPPLSIWI